MAIKGKTIDLDFATIDDNGYVNDHTGSTSVTLLTTSPGDHLAHKVTVTNVSAVSRIGETVTFTGTDQDNPANAETITGPASSATVTSTYYFKTVSDITRSSAAGTFDMGWTNQVVSQTIPLDTYSGEVAIGVDVTGTLVYTMQHTHENVSTTSARNLTWWDNNDTALVSASTDQDGNYVRVPQATRIKVSSYATAAEVQLYLNQRN